MKFRLSILISFVLFGLLMAGFLKGYIPLWVLIVLVHIEILLLVLGAINIQWNFYIKSINSVDEFARFNKENTHSEKKICLTFDDGIHNVNTVKALDILKEKNVKAMFFLIGKNMNGNESILKRMHDEGHVIGNHSELHLWNFDLQSADKMAQEINNTNESIEKITGVKPNLFRPPYGVTNPNLAKAILQTNMLSIGWNLRSFDTVAKSGNDLLKKLKAKTKPDSIVLVHERCDVTVEVLTEYIDYCLEQGFTFVTLKV